MEDVKKVPERIASVRISIPPSIHALYIDVVHKTRFGLTTRRRARSREYEDWIGATVPILHTLPKLSLPASITIEVHGGHGWRADRDLDNCAKAILDALVSSERIPDDKVAYVQEIVLRYIDGAPRRANRHRGGRADAYVLLSASV